MSFLRRLRSYIALTKPSILLLVLITGAAGLVLEGSLLARPLNFALVLLLLAMAGGSANAFNQYFEREVDAAMTRTRLRRPLPLKSVTPAGALICAGLLGIASTALFGMLFNWLSASLSLATILFYSLFYTIYLKPRTPLNIVIGGAAGAMSPVIAWAAAAGRMDIIPWLLFAIIFFWTPPHFWALALCFKEDYRQAQYPMLPLVKGDEVTWRQMAGYTLVTVAASLAVGLWDAALLYLPVAVGLGWLFLRKVARGRRSPSPRAAWGVFGFSIVYLLSLFTALMLDSAINRLL